MMRVLLSAVAIVLASCSSDALLNGPKVEVWPDRPMNVLRPTASVEQHSKYTLGIVEINDAGKFRSTQQFQLVTDTLNRVALERGVTLVIFVHGWHHGAEPDDSNLADFRDILNRLGKASNIPVMGIYLAWRGEPLDRRWRKTRLSTFSFWNREFAAQRVGVNGGAEDLLAINWQVDSLRVTKPI